MNRRGFLKFLGAAPAVAAVKAEAAPALVKPKCAVCNDTGTCFAALGEGDLWYSPVEMPEHKDGFAEICCPKCVPPTSAIAKWKLKREE